MTPVLSMMKPVPNPRIWNGLRRPVNGETSTSSLTVLIVTTLGSAACTIGARLTGSPRTMGDPDVARAAEGAGVVAPLATGDAPGGIATPASSPTGARVRFPHAMTMAQAKTAALVPRAQAIPWSWTPHR